MSESLGRRKGPDDEREATHDGGEDPDAAGGGRRPKRPGGLSGEEPQRGDVAPVAEAVWADGGRRGQAAEGTGAGEHRVEEDAGGVVAEEPGFGGCMRKK